MSQIPTPGRIVLYTLSEDDAKRINKRREDAIAIAHEHKMNPEATGKQVHIGNAAHDGDVLPAIIVRPWGTTPTSSANLQVFLDGNDTFWVTSVSAGEGPRRFAWPNTAPSKVAETGSDEASAAPGVETVVVTVSQIKAALESLGIESHRLREIHFDLSRVTVTRVVDLPAGSIPSGDESRYEIETYPIVRR